MTFGIIFHWGVYSVPAYDSIKSAKRRNIQNGSEWYLKRLLPTKYIKTSGSKETLLFHEENYKGIKYEDFVRLFAVNNDIEEKIDDWMKLCKNIGAKYVILTAKHHDGICLWKLHKDFIKIFKEKAENNGLEFGVYYSWYEFDKPFTIDFFEKVCVPHINELLSYNPKHWWFDGDWVIKQKYVLEKIDRFCDTIRKINPNVSINDRIGKIRYVDINQLDKATYRVYSDRHIPIEIPKISWQHINTIGYSWGYNRDQKSEDYKTGEQLFEIYNKVVELGGDFLLNLGPKSNGDLDENELKSLVSFSNYMNQ